MFKNEVVTMLLLAFVIFPFMMAICVGAFGLVVWLLQLFVIGLPSA
ncbi:nitrate/trimethylamine N-oxide reductase NapE/TorE [Spirabiliibacterium mucosae]